MNWRKIFIPVFITIMLLAVGYNIYQKYFQSITVAHSFIYKINLPQGHFFEWIIVGIVLTFIFLILRFAGDRGMPRKNTIFLRFSRFIRWPLGLMLLINLFMGTCMKNEWYTPKFFDEIPYHEFEPDNPRHKRVGNQYYAKKITRGTSFSPFQFMEELTEDTVDLAKYILPFFPSYQLIKADYKLYSPISLSRGSSFFQKATNQLSYITIKSIIILGNTGENTKSVFKIRIIPQRRELKSVKYHKFGKIALTINGQGENALLGELSLCNFSKMHKFIIHSQGSSVISLPYSEGCYESELKLQIKGSHAGYIKMEISFPPQGPKKLINININQLS